MSEEVENDDQWLYGEGHDFPPQDENSKQQDSPVDKQANESEENNKSQDGPPKEQDTNEFAQESTQDKEMEDGQPSAPGDEEENNDDENQNGDKEDTDDDDDSDDDVNVVIGDIKTSPAYSLNIKRGGLIGTAVGDKNKLNQQQSGKFTVEEFDQMGMINGVPAADYNMDAMDDKPWRKPGADITDYFNYGFNEDTWKAYCERQKRLRVNESGVGLIPLNSIGMPRGPIPIMNDNSKYSGTFTGIRKAGPPPGRRMTGAIDVIGGSGGQPTPGKIEAPKENVIQVMTADRREYSRKPPGFPDMSMPPPQSFEAFQPEFGFNPEPEPFYDNYEPTQDLQWGPNSAWAPGVKSLTPGPTSMPPVGPPIASMSPMGMPPTGGGPIGGPPGPIGPGGPIPPQMVPPVMPQSQPPVGYSPPRDSPPPPSSRNESIAREVDHHSSSRRSEIRAEKSRDRERSHRRDRSRSRSRRHKSRSRSPGHRHRKKKSRRHEDSD